MSDAGGGGGGGASSSTNSKKLNSSTLSNKKRTLSDAGLDDAAESDSQSNGKRVVVFEPFKLIDVQSAEELDAKLLLIQNKKLYECVQNCRKAEIEWKSKIDQLETNKASVDCKWSMIDLYWTQLDEDIRRLLERFDATTSTDGNNQSSSTSSLTNDETTSNSNITNTTNSNENKERQGEETRSYIHQLNTWLREDLDEHLKQRLDFSTKAIVKLVRAFDNLSDKYQRLFTSINSSSSTGESNSIPECTNEVYKVVLERNADLEHENDRIQRLNTTLQSRIHEITLRCSDLNNQLVLQEEQLLEKKSHLSDLEYELEKSRSKETKLERALADAITKLEHDRLKFQANDIKHDPDSNSNNSNNNTIIIAENKYADLQAEIEEYKELAAGRLAELEKLMSDHETTKREVEVVKNKLRSLPEELINETPEFKCLQSRYTALVNESVHLRHQLSDARELVKCTKTIYDHHFEKIEQEEFENQRKLIANIEQVVADLAEARRDYDLLQVEYEKVLIANQQSVPITREMRSLINHLQAQCKLYSLEASRCKKQCKELEEELTKLKAKQETIISNGLNTQISMTTLEPTSASSINTTNQQQSPSIKDETINPFATSTSTVIKNETIQKEESTEGNDDSRLVENSLLDFGDVTEGDLDDNSTSNALSRLSSNPMTTEDKDTELRTLKSENKKLSDMVKEYKILLTMYRSAPKETRDKANLMTSEKKLRQELEETRNELKKVQNYAKTLRKKCNEDEVQNKMRSFQETIRDLEKNLETRKQEEAALLNEIEVTGQAFEDMQEQNSRLLSQLREKDDAHIKLMVERVKLQQAQKIMSDEKTVLAQQTNVLQEQLDAQVIMNQKYEETIALLRNTVLILEKELSMMHQTLDAHKRKTIESAQTSADLKLHLDRYHAQLKEVQELVAEKSEALEKQNFKNRRLQEELKNLNRKLERMRKLEMASNKDEVLLEEIREYKEILRCPACKNKQRDAILSKCFHVFCYDCLKSRYDSRQRKCPKCNTAFGQSDMHKIWLV
ncbi:unnamed protein product [Rotaria sordida]|uniref:E3 ubiquitin protein ligase n=1 Tax=Rotaria sordida TaxID=392033 RepID=A0A814C9J7_9BILA|nr:unnamed protein product [Rotaria sordida]CAF0969405.1 unnamed protein product [Rotaria sordida]